MRLFPSTSIRCGGSEANKLRPVALVSNDRASAAAQRLGRGGVAVVPVTSNVSRAFPFQVLLPAEETRVAGRFQGPSGAGACHRAGEAWLTRGWLPQPVAGQPGGAFAVVQKAVFARERLRLTYRSRQAATVRELIVEPHGLVSAGSDWYLCATDDERVRFLKMARIEEAVPLAEPCRGPEPDVAQAWHEHRDRFLQQLTPVTVVGWVRERRLQEAREWSIRAGDVEFSQHSPGDGWQPVSLEFMDDLHAVTALLRLGPDARVEAPERIRLQLLDYVDQIRCQYQTS